MPPTRNKPTNPILQLFKQMLFLGLENFGKYYSTYRAFVYDNEDPLGTQRLKLIIPQVTGNDFHDYWAFPHGVFYGDGYGQQIIPQKGDVVWVQFEGGEVELPVWSHGHPGKKEVPTDSKLRDVNSYWFVTPKGHKVYINDTKNTIHIEHNSGQAVELNDNSVSVVSAKAISLGTLDKSKYSAVLGEELVSILKDLQKYTKDTYTALDADVKAAAPYLAPVKTKIALPLLQKLVDGLEDKIAPILSKINTLD